MTNKQYDILVLNAHPDDSEMAMGGTLLTLARSGKTILNLSLTKGQAGTSGSADIRTTEFFAAQSFIGSDGVLRDYQDTRLEVTLPIIEDVATCIRMYKPKIVFSPYRKNDFANFDGMHNRDHAVCGEIASHAIKLARLKNSIPHYEPHVVQKLFYYMIPAGVFPQMLFDVSSVIDDTKKLISSYHSQVAHTNLIERLMSLRMAHGSIGRLEYAEAFVSEMPIVLTSENIFSV